MAKKPITGRHTSRPDPLLESFLNTLRGDGWIAADYGNGLLPADAPRGACIDAKTGRYYAPGEPAPPVVVTLHEPERRRIPRKKRA
jgi:hypothetical protein